MNKTTQPQPASTSQALPKKKKAYMKPELKPCQPKASEKRS